MTRLCLPSPQHGPDTKQPTPVHPDARSASQGLDSPAGAQPSLCDPLAFGRCFSEMV